MSTIGTFTLIKNEAVWIKAHLLSWLPWVDEMVFYDGDSTDGTLDIIRDVKDSHPFGNRIKLFLGKDPSDLAADYTRLFNECIGELSTDYAMFAHPDMIIDEPGNIGFLGEHLAYYSHMRSFAGDPGGQLYEITSGRSKSWKNIYRLRRPDLGLHYAGAYGSVEEDCYFSKITGAEHEYHGEEYHKYPYEVGDSGVRILHYSDVRPRERRLDRMLKCLRNQNRTEAEVQSIAAIHPRVTLEPGHGFGFMTAEYHPLLLNEMTTQGAA